MVVVKVGGSLCVPHWQAALLAWLEQRARAGPMVVVCGGGAFADTVRREQRRLDYDDATAHRQALLAMEQTAWWLQQAWREAYGRCPAVRPDGGAGTLWTPRALLEDTPDVPMSWAVTSDSLAAWLAGRSAADALVLLKSLPLQEAGGSPAAWAAQGWVDAGFADFAARAGCPVRLLGRAGWGAPTG